MLPFPFSGRGNAETTRLAYPTNVFTSFVMTKGLSNNTGENNCFLNSAVQILWHLDAFRKNFNLLSHHACLENSCIFCALKVIFTQFQFSDEKVLPPDALRKALAVAFENQQRFQLHLMDDAAECFENILNRIHYHLSNGNTDDNCTLEHCIPHRKFAMTIIEQVVCECSATSEPLSFVQLVHYVTASAVISLSQQLRSGFNFSDALRLAHSDGNPNNKCPGSKCSREARLDRTLTNIPDVISIGLIWDSDQQSAEQVKSFVEAVGTHLELPRMFDRVVEKVETAEHRLVGMVCYYGRHYSAFLLHSKSNNWMSCDDATVTDMGPSWQSIVDKCHKGRYQPLLLLYQNPSSKCISTKSAPTKTTMLTEQDTEAESSATGNDNNCCNIQQPKVATMSDRRPAPTSARSTSPSIETSLEPVRPLPGPLINAQVAGRETGLDSYRVSPDSGVPLSLKTEEPVAGFGVRCVPMAMPNYYQPQYADRYSRQFSPQPHNVVGAGASNRVEAGSSPVANPASRWTEQRESPANFQHVASIPAQLPNQHFDQCDLNSGMLAQGSTTLGTNFLSTAPSPGGASGSRLLNRDYVETYNRADHPHSSDGWQLPHVPHGDAQAASDFNSLEWNIIDRDSILSSPKTPFSNLASGLASSGSTSSLYDNLSDFGIVGIDGRMLHPDTDAISISNSSQPVDMSLTESYYIVPSAENFDRFMGDRNFKDLTTEANELMQQSKEKERTGDLQAALICCNQANSLYAASQRQQPLNPGFPPSEVDLMRVQSYNRSTLLSHQIEINQQRSKSNAHAKGIVADNRNPSKMSIGTNKCPANVDLIFLDEPEPPVSKYQVLKDRLPLLYTQQYGPSNVLHK